MMKVLILSCVVAVVAAAPTVVLSDNDGTSCKMIKAGTTIESNCDQAVQGRPSASILGNHNALQELQRINVLQARENTALRKLVAELTTRVDQLAQTQSQTMETLRNQYEAADDKLQDAINHISLTPGPQGAPGQKRRSQRGHASQRYGCRRHAHWCHREAHWHRAPQEHAHGSPPENGTSSKPHISQCKT